MPGLEFKDFGRPIKIRAEDGQGLEAQIVGTTKQVPEYDFKVLDNIMVFDAEKVTTPAGQKTVDWVKSLKPDFVKMEAKTYKHGQ